MGKPKIISYHHLDKIDDTLVDKLTEYFESYNALTTYMCAEATPKELDEIVKYIKHISLKGEEAIEYIMKHRRLQ